MRRLLPLLIVFIWYPLPFDCHGGPDTIVGYLAFDAEIVIARYDVCTVDGVDFACPVYAYTPWRPSASLTTERYDWPAPDVGLGEIALLNVEQVDAAGNISGGECP